MISVLIRRTLLFAALIACASAAAADPQFLGFLEDRMEPAARVAFQKTSKGWKSFCPPDHRILAPESCRPVVEEVPSRWIVVYRGEPKGTVETKDYRPHFLADVGLYSIVDPDAAPMVGEPDAEFAGQIPHSTHRPLVVLAAPAFADPQGWTAMNPEEADLRRLWRPFVDAAGNASTCSTDPEDDKTVPWDYQFQHLRVFQAYTAKQTGAQLIGLHLDPAMNNCDGARARAWSTFWFYVDRKSRVKPLEFLSRNSAAGRGHVAKVLDWGDYDADGQSEVVFWLESSNEDGYVLFYDEFTKEETFSWIYR